MSPETRFGMSSTSEDDLEQFTPRDQTKCINRLRRFEQHVREGMSRQVLRNIYGLKGLRGRQCKSLGQFSTQEIRALSQDVRLVFMDVDRAPTAYWVVAFRKGNDRDYDRACQQSITMWDTPHERRPRLRA